MSREEIFSLIQSHLADELDVDPARIDESTRFKDDLEADSLDLYTLVQELEDSYGVGVSDGEAVEILSDRDAVALVMVHGARPAGVESLRALLDGLPEELRRRTSTTGPWPERRSGAYARLVLHGHSVLGLAVTAFLSARLEADRYVAGRLTKSRAQGFSGLSCREVAGRLG